MSGIDLKSCDFYSRLSVVQTPQQLQTVIGESLATLGLDSFRFLGLAEQPSVLSNWPQELLDLSLSGNYTQSDLMVKHALSRLVPICHSAAVEYVTNAPFYVRDSQQFLAVCKKLAEYGCHDTYNIPYETFTGTRFLLAVSKLGLNSDALQQLVERVQPLLYLLGDIATGIAVRRFAPYFIGRSSFLAQHNLHEKHLQLLRLLATGNMDLQTAAKRLFISIDTANKYIRTIKQALGAKTHAAAVYRAIVTGLIDVDSPE